MSSASRLSLADILNESDTEDSDGTVPTSLEVGDAMISDSDSRGVSPAMTNHSSSNRTRYNSTSSIRGRSLSVMSEPSLEDILASDEDDDDEDRMNRRTSTGLVNLPSASAEYQKILEQALHEETSSDSDEDASSSYNSNKSSAASSMKGLSSASSSSSSSHLRNRSSVSNSSIRSRTASSMGVIPPLAKSDSQLREIKDALDRAEGYETQLASVGNYQLLSPLRSIRMINASDSNIGSKVLCVSERKGVKTYLANYREKIGLPTSIGTSTKVAAVGTSRGVVLLFDNAERLLKPALDARKHGAVTAIAINSDATFLVAAYASSAILIWDLTKRVLYKTIDPSQSDTDHAPVVDIEFLPSDGLQLVTVNAVGTCEVLSITKILFTVSVSRSCLLSGHGQEFPVVTVAALAPNPRWQHPCDYFNLIAFANEAITLIVALKPALQVLYKRARLPDARKGAVPTLSWRQLQFEDHDKEYFATCNSRKQLLIAHPVLTISRGHTIDFIQIGLKPQKLLQRSQEAKEMPLEFRVLEPMMLVSTDVDIVNCVWIMGELAFCTTSNGEVRALDPSLLLELDRVKHGGTQLVYQESPSRGGGRAERNFAGSAGVAAGQVCLMGMNSMIAIRPYLWHERVQLLIDAGSWIEALALALKVFCGDARGIVGLPRHGKSLRNVILGKLVQFLKQYLTVAFHATTPQQQQQQEEDIKQSTTMQNVNDIKVIAGVAIEYCIVLKIEDILFDYVYPKFNGNEVSRGVFLELLEPYVLNDLLVYIHPIVMTDFIEHYSKNVERGLRKVELCITHLDLSLADINLLARLCGTYHLFSALLYIYNAALADYMQPLRMCLLISLQHLSSSSSSSSSSASDENKDGDALNESLSPRVLGSKLLLYVQYSLQGRRFPSGDNLDASIKHAIRLQIASLLFDKHLQDGEGILQCELQGVPEYPWLRYLLNVSAVRLLEILKLVFEDQIDHASSSSSSSPRSVASNQASYSSSSQQQQQQRESSGLSTMSLSSSSQQQQQQQQPLLPPAAVDTRQIESIVKPVAPSNIPTCQEMFDILCSFILDTQNNKEQQDNKTTTLPTAVHDALRYEPQLSDQMALYNLYSCYFVDGLITVNAAFVQRAARVLMESDANNFARRNANLSISLEKQSSLLQMLKHVLERPSAQSSYSAEWTPVLMKAHDVGYYDICAYIYRCSGDFANVVDCGLKACDSAVCAMTNEEFFAYLTACAVDGKVDELLLLQSDSVDAKKFVSVAKQTILQRVPDLVGCDSVLAAKCIAQAFPDDMQRVVEALAPFPELQFRYLRGVHYMVEGMPQEESADAMMMMTTASQGGEGGLRRTSGFMGTHLPNVALRGGVQQEYIKLMCTFAPQDVYRYLTTHHEYDPDQVLHLCTDHKISDATAYLLERTGDYPGALRMTLKGVDDRIALLRPRLHDAKIEEANLHTLREFQSVLQIINMAIQLCERSSDAEELWFSLLEKFVELGRTANKISTKQQQIQPLHDDRNAKQKLLTAFLGQRQEKQLMKASLRDFTSKVLNEMMEHVPLTKVVSRISQQHKHEHFAEFREAFLSALLTSQYVENIYTTATKLTAKDTFVDIDHKVRKMKMPMTTTTTTTTTTTYLQQQRQHVCSFCGVSIHDVPLPGLASLIFQCGHVFHSTCVIEESVHQCRVCAAEGVNVDLTPLPVNANGRQRIKWKQQTLLQRLQLEESKHRRQNGLHASIARPDPQQSAVYDEKIMYRASALHDKDIDTRLSQAQKIEGRMRRDRKTFHKYMESYEEALLDATPEKMGSDMLNLVPAAWHEVEPVGNLRNAGVLPEPEHAVEVDEFDFGDDFFD